jgi:hypothetical protein
MVQWVKGLMNHPMLKATTNMGLYYAHTQGGEVVCKFNEIHIDENMPLLLGNVVRKGKDSQRKPRHGGQTLQS